MQATSFTALTPLAFLERAADVFADKTAIAYGDRRVTYAEFGAEATRLAHALRASGVRAGDRVAYLCPNIPEMLVANFGVPLAGAVLVPINHRLSAEEVRYICDHSGAKVLVVDSEYLEALAPVQGALRTVTEVVAVEDALGPAGPDAAWYADISYDELLQRGSGDSLPWTVDDESSLISINYTSGTTGTPKGVMYAHRGAYLNALGEIIHQRFDPESVYLWTLPMFHCNGWCTPWAVTAIGGTHVCLRAVRPDVIWRLLDEERVTHLDGAPTVLTMIADCPLAHQLDRELVATVAGAPPSPSVIARMRELGARIVHVYGMTEVYGPYALNEWQAGWSALPPGDQARRQARQGVAMIQADPVRVVDEEMNDVPRDGRAMGEIVMRGNTVMLGYFDDQQATDAVFRGGWLHSGDLGVQHSDGYVELRDRAKDIIISGGENISTVEIEHAIEAHPSVLEAVVIGVPDEKWGERPKAFVVRRGGAEVNETELIGFLQTHIARFKIPKAVEFLDRLPRTSTGKPQKFELREKEWAGHSSRNPGMSSNMLADGTYNEGVLASTDIGCSLGTDYFGLRDELTDTERDYLRRARSFVDTEVLPVISDYWERAEFPWPLVKSLGALGIVGDGIEGYGCPAMSPVAAGLIHMELNRGDGSLGTIHAVQAGLAMRSIWLLGSEEQRNRWLPGMARMDLLGAFALTEAAHGSDAVALETTATPDGGGYRLDGEKRWIGNGTMADVVVVWARDTSDERVKGFLVERGAPGYDATVIVGKGSVRAVLQADITLTGVRVPAGNVLPGARSFKDAVRVLASTRIAVAWGALGHAVAAYEAALAYTKQRTQFGKPLVGFQLVQDQLVKMLAEVTAMQLYCLRISRLEEQSKLTDTIAALAKMNNTLKARQVIADARDLLGGNGILLDNHVMRHMADIEAIYTYEGTEHIQTLIVGRDITGVSAFA